MATSVPQIAFTPAGVVIPTDAAILAGVQTDIDSAFGGGVNPGLSTPQGQLASSEAAIISDKDGEIAFIVQQFDPNYASGRFQDALAQIYFLTRKGATSTTGACTLTGIPTSVVPAGTLAQDTSGNTYVLLGSVTIGSGGTVSSNWQNIATGPIPCPAGTLIKVYQAVAGWDAITNPADFTLGQDVESRSAFEFRRANSVALNGRGTTEAIYSNVFDVNNVLDCFVVDNPTGVTVNYGPTAYPLAPHSVYVAVLGGLDADIAQAIWSKKDVGCSYNGNTTVVVTDQSGYSFPYPTYNVTFERPSSLPIFFNVQIANVASLPSNIATLIKNAIVAQFNGTNGSIRARIAAAVIAAQYYGPVSAVGNNVVLLGIQVGITGPGALEQVQVGIDQAPTLDPADITVTLI